MKPAATLSPFCSEISTDFIMRRTAGASTAKDFSMKTFTPLATAYSKCAGRKAAGVVSIATSPLRRESMAFL